MKSLKRHLKSIAIVLAIILVALLPMLFNTTYNLGLLILIMLNAILAMAFIMTLRTGLINMGLTAFWGLGAYVSVILVMKLHLSFWLSLPATTLISAGFAWGLGYFLIGIGSGGLSFVVLTSVIGMLFTVLIGNISYLGGFTGISNIPAPDPIRIPFLPPIEFVSNVQFFYLALVLLLVVILIFKALYNSWVGRAWIATGLSARLAESIGVDISKYKLLSFVLSSAAAGLVGCFFAHYQSFIMPDTFTMWRNIYIQIYAILGGIGFAILGPLVGSTVMTIFPEFMRSSMLLAQIFIGIILILLIIFFPEGILGLLEWRTSGVEKIKQYLKTIGTFLSPKRKAGKL